jgi:hypothetical protein
MDIAFLGADARMKCLTFLRSILEFPFPGQNNKVFLLSFDKAYLFTVAQQMKMFEASFEWLSKQSTLSFFKPLLLSHPLILTPFLPHQGLRSVAILVIENVHYSFDQFLYNLFQSLPSSVQVVIPSEDPLSQASLTFLPRFFRSPLPSKKKVRWARPRLVKVHFPIQWQHEMKDLACRECGQCDHHGQDLSLISYAELQKLALSFLCKTTKIRMYCRGLLWIRFAVFFQRNMRTVSVPTCRNHIQNIVDLF